MDDALLNCMTANCCPPAQQIQALSAAMVKAGVFRAATAMAEASGADGPSLDDVCAQACAAWMVKHFDFAEKGTLKPLRESIIRLHKARG